MKTWLDQRAGIALLILVIASCPAWAGRRAGRKTEDAQARAVGLFEAMEAGEIEVRLIPKNAREAQVQIQNKSDQPLTVRLPEAFAGVPVLAQIDGGNVNRGGNVGGGGANQAFGGGFGGGLGGLGGLGGGIFNVGPDQVRKVKVTTVCLEHGKPDPAPRVPYALRPIATFTDNAALIEICKMLGRGELDQQSAQAAAWHLSDQLSWNQLAAKVRIRHLNGATERYFSEQHLYRAIAAVQVAHARAARDSETGYSDSRSAYTVKTPTDPTDKR